jgi:hypothetical protein
MKRALLVILVSVVPAFAPARAAAGAPAWTGPAGVSAPSSAGESCGPAPRPARLQAVSPLALRRDGAQAAEAYPLYHWPLDRQLHDKLLIVNYMDHDPTAGILDYSGGTHSYDGHTGTDITLYDFRMMDRGCRILAASPGTVAYIGSAAPGAFDRNCAGPWVDDGNWVWVDNGDGTYSEYLHMRAWSMTVQLGEHVEAGQVLGLIGSSGYALAPHLHFETGDYFNAGNYTNRDPFHGSQNPLASLWLSQPDYEGDDSLWFANQGVFTETEVPGGVGYTSYCEIQENIPQPVVFGIHEPNLDLWFQFQGNTGDPYEIRVVRPDGSTFASYPTSLGYKAQFDWFWVYWPWDGSVSASDYGTWKLRSYANGRLSLETPFAVGPATIYGPRLQRSGRSFRINGSAQRDTLRSVPFGPPLTYTLLNAPAFVTLSDSVVTIAGTSTQPTRSLFFQVIAKDAAARADTAWYHVVDLSKPLETTLAASPAPAANGLQLSVAPTPTRGDARLSFSLPAAGPVSLAVFDLGGRRVRVLERGVRTPGEHVARWDGRDEWGAPVAAGLYFARLTLGDRTTASRLVVVR